MTARPLRWTNQDITLYHGTTTPEGIGIVLSGVDLSFGRPRTDFGRGFYTTTSLRQARVFSGKRSKWRGAPQAVVEFTIQRARLAQLDTLAFVLGTPEAADFWSLVDYCRNGLDGHARFSTGDAAFYDVVFGPVTKSVGGRSLYRNYDQVSFHTPKAIQFLNQAGGRKMI